MDVLLETHNEGELERALRLPSPLIGINNRDLKRMVTDLATTERLAPLVPDDKVLISESGVSSPENIERLRKTGARRFLIGESLMKMGINRHKSVTQMRVVGTN
jgi:indole-3-glycerol phosphate synthase